MTSVERGRDPFVALRRELHRSAELSGAERGTAAHIREALRTHRPDDLVTDLGGHGVAARWQGAAPGRNVLLRCELDALPIADRVDLPHASRTPGVAHKCGHDGHMATLVAVAARLAAARPEAGAVTLLFQPAEETGEGAARVLADPAFAGLEPDVVVALHNLPGLPVGAVVLRDGPFAFGSVGAALHFTGAESHAAEPERGRSPASALADAIHALRRIGSPEALPRERGAVTVTHAQLGQPAFGTSPGAARVFATLRAGTEADLADLRRTIESHVTELAHEHGLDAAIEWHEPFPVTTCDPGVVRHVEASATALGLRVVSPEEPFRWSEDFGHFTARFPGALFGLGAGETHPALHHPDYDFPDELIAIGADLMTGAARSLASGRPATTAGTAT